MKWGKQHHVMHSIADFVAKAKARQMSSQDEYKKTRALTTSPSQCP